jgi:hypothetical protein
MENNDNSIQLVIDLYNDMLAKKEALKQAKKKFKDLHNSIIDIKRAALQKQIPEVDLKERFPWAVVGVEFYLKEGMPCDLIISSSEKDFECFVVIRPIEFRTLSREQFMEFADNFQGIFTHYNFPEKFYADFKVHQYNEVFACFSKAYKKLNEIGAKIVKK